MRVTMRHLTTTRLQYFVQEYRIHNTWYWWAAVYFRDPAGTR
jgi:hypothetical protein